MSNAFSENAYLLAPLKGEKPPQSAWFAGELAKEPERSTFVSEGSQVELLTWGEVGAPGILLLHGMGAHADWWRFIAPALAQGHRVAAISWPGMGGSDWREAYTLPQLARDIMNTLEIAGLERGPRRPILIGHSFGGLPLLQAICDFPDRIGGGVMIDSFIPQTPRPSQWAAGRDAMPVYPTIEAALARYRFAPVQSAVHLDIVDFIARGSLQPVDGGWTWRFDPNLWAKLDRANANALLDNAALPVAILYGERSALVSAEMVEEMRAHLQYCPIVAAIPDAAHHLMIDQTVAIISALRVVSAALWELTSA